MVVTVEQLASQRANQKAKLNDKTDKRFKTVDIKLTQKLCEEGYQAAESVLPEPMLYIYNGLTVNDVTLEPCPACDRLVCICKKEDKKKDKKK